MDEEVIERQHRAVRLRFIDHERRQSRRGTDRAEPEGKPQDGETCVAVLSAVQVSRQVARQPERSGDSHRD